MWFLFYRLQDCSSSCFCCLPFGGWGYLRGLCKFPLESHSELSLHTKNRSPCWLRGSQSIKQTMTYVRYHDNSSTKFQVKSQERESEKLIWDVLAPEWAKLRGEGWLILWHFIQKIVSVGKMISRTGPEIRKQVYYRSVNNKRKVMFQASRGWNIGKLPSQRLRHKNGAEQEHKCCTSVPWIESYLNPWCLKWGHCWIHLLGPQRPPPCGENGCWERRVSLQCDNVKWRPIFKTKNEMNKFGH